MLLVSQALVANQERLNETAVAAFAAHFVASEYFPNERDTAVAHVKSCSICATAIRPCICHPDCQDLVFDDGVQ